MQREIRKHYLELTKKLRINDLFLSYLLDHVISEEEYEKLRDTGNMKERTRLFLSDILRNKKEDAWDPHFFCALRITGQNDLCDLLNPFKRYLSDKNEPYFDSISKFVLQKRVPEQLEIRDNYALDSNDKLKIVLNLNAEEGDGHICLMQFNQLFEDEMGIQKYVEMVNKSSSELIEKLREESKPAFQNIQCYFFLHIQTHGKSLDIRGYDDAIIPITTILENFTTSSCSHLSGKPKIFIFCVNCDICSDDDLSKIQLEIDTFLKRDDAKDILICVVPIIKPENMSFIPNKLNWFIFDLLNLILTHSYQVDLLSTLKAIFNPGRFTKKPILAHSLDKVFHFGTLYQSLQ